MSCSWCGRAIDAGDGYRLTEAPRARRAAFCRLEHVIPWSIRGERWEAGGAGEPQQLRADAGRCAHCEAPLGEAHLLLVRHRGAHRIPDGFCSVAHLVAWAKAGGRYG